MIIGIECTVDDLGRVVIPKKYRDLYDIKEKDKLYVLGTEEGLQFSKRNFKLVEVEEN